jgi:hypothetical protein
MSDPVSVLCVRCRFCDAPMDSSNFCDCLLYDSEGEESD